MLMPVFVDTPGTPVDGGTALRQLIDLEEQVTAHGLLRRLGDVPYEINARVFVREDQMDGRSDDNHGRLVNQSADVEPGQSRVVGICVHVCGQCLARAPALGRPGFARPFHSLHASWPHARPGSPHLGRPRIAGRVPVGPFSASCLGGDGHGRPARQIRGCLLALVAPGQFRRHAHGLGPKGAQFRPLLGASRREVSVADSEHPDFRRQGDTRQIESLIVVVISD